MVDSEPGTGLSYSQHEGGSFTPAKGLLTNTGPFTGVSIRKLPRGADQGDILELLITCGLPETKTENVSFNNNGTVIVKDCLTLIKAIHGAKILKGSCNVMELFHLLPRSKTILYSIHCLTFKVNKMHSSK